MKTNLSNTETFDENQSVEVIREMLKVSQKKLKNDGILFIVWGWLMFYNYTSNYLIEKLIFTYRLQRAINIIGYLLAILAVAFSIYYILKERKRVQTYIGISLRYVWLSLLVCLSLTNMIMFNILHRAFFELQHPVFMLFIAFATVITGGIMRYQLVVFGGIAFGILAYIASYFSLQEQMLFDAAAWLIAFIIPGHILFVNRKN